MIATNHMAADASNPHRFDVALSFPGEHRDYVKEVAAHLAAVFSEDRVLYDHFHDAEFARLDLHTYLPALYRKDSELIVIFLCPEYAAKLWCRLEWRHISQLIATVDAKRIMFLSFGNPGDLSDLGILAGDGYVNALPLTPQVAAEKILKRLSLNKGTTAPLTQPVPAPASLVHADISRIDKYAPAELIGRETETQLLSDAWNKAVSGDTNRPRVLTFVALGGEGKTSLVAKWAADLAHRNWPGCDAVFAWSFYSQGTREQTAASSDLFLKEALTFFGDQVLAESNQSAFDKGRRLAQLVGQQRALLILDGVEPLQYAPGPPMDGKLKDDGIASLIKGLASANRGLCLITTRYSIPDLRAYMPNNAQVHELKRLSNQAGVRLLKKLGVREESGSTEEFEKLVEDVKGHALTLNLLGSYLHEAHAGDIRKRDLVKLEEADEEHGGHAFRVMDAYVNWFNRDDGKAAEKRRGQRDIAILLLLGLFDRPATADCLGALLRAPDIQGLTEPFATLTVEQRNMSFSRLEDTKLITVIRDGSGALLALDAHPLVREYFSQKLQAQYSAAWRAAHRRLYEHLCATTKEGDQPTLEDLQPLYQAVTHGCKAGMEEEARAKVYYDRIQRGPQFYSTRKLGAYGADLGALACFFVPPWSRVSAALTETAHAWLLSNAAFRLRALGRLTEALEPMQAALLMELKQENWKNAAIISSNLSELKLTLGEVAGAVGDAEQSVNYADHSDDAFQRLSKRTTHADALHHAGRRDEAQARFREAEEMQAVRRPDYALLDSFGGIRYCDLLLASIERAAWQCILRSEGLQPADFAIEPEILRGTVTDRPLFPHGHATSSAAQDARAPQIKACRAVSRRAAQTLQWMQTYSGAPLLDVPLDYLTLGRAALYEAILEGSSLDRCHSSLQHAVAGLRLSGAQHHIPGGLLTRAWLSSLAGAYTGSESAQSDLDEAWGIAERGPMPLFLADIHLHRARLFHAVTPYPWSTDSTGTPRGPKDDLAAARVLITKHGYLRRLEELEDAEVAATNWV